MAPGTACALSMGLNTDNGAYDGWGGAMWVGLGQSVTLDHGNSGGVDHVHTFSTPVPPPSPPLQPGPPLAPIDDNEAVVDDMGITIDPDSVLVDTAASLAEAVNGVRSPPSRIIIAPGRYTPPSAGSCTCTGSSWLCIARNLIIEAQIPGTVVLDGDFSMRLLCISQ